MAGTRRDALALTDPFAGIVEGIGNVEAGETPRILVIDDEGAVRRACARGLRAAGFTAFESESAASALDHIQNSHFDVIVTDVSMPGMTGIELLRRVRAFDLDVPVVMMSGKPDVEAAATALEWGAYRYLIKPFAIDELIDLVAMASRVHRLAKLRQRSNVAFHHDDRALADRASLATHFDVCLDTLWMAYQPIVNCQTHTVVAYEALMRSQHPPLPDPGAVLDAAERLDRLAELGEVLRDKIARDVDRVPANALVFVNLHAADLTNDDLVDSAASLSRHAARVVLEITERASLDRVPDVRERVARLRRLGFRVAIDDLGAGYAGLTSFIHLEPEFVKLDMSLVRDVHQSEVKRNLVGAVLEVCGDMRVGVVAEGIERSAERDTLAALGCDVMQGFLFARPDRLVPMVHW